MLYSEMVRLRLEPKQTWMLKIFNKGIDRIWHNYDYYKREVVVQFLGSSNDVYHPVYRETIENELDHLNKIIVQDAVKIQPESPRRLKVTEALYDHPSYRAERDAVKKHFKNIREVRIPIPSIKEMNRKYEKVYGFKEGTELDDFKGVDHKNNEVILEVGDIEDGYNVRNL
jgi:pyruvate/2-oxoacid:ferredoxin oxidoreductase alpha subunit